MKLILTLEVTSGLYKQDDSTHGQILDKIITKLATDETGFKVVIKDSKMIEPK